MNRKIIRSRSFIVHVSALCLCGLCATAAPRPATSGPAGVYDIREFGARGDGATLDSASINAAITAAFNAGGGTVRFPAGTYLSVSIHLRSNISIYLEAGAVIVAATQSPECTYDAPEPNAAEGFQDFGHSHWHNGLLWGENIENISISGPGMIWGKGLVRGHKRPDDGGDKSIALKLCRNVIIRDISIKHGGHFAILASGVENLTVDNVKIDTNRDGIDLDCCRGVRISNCSVNAPYDDGICLKSSLALGQPRATENVTIANCQFSGYDEGTLLDGTCKREDEKALRIGPTSRFKLGTESNGGFRNVTVSNCVFDYCRGLAIESVDGGVVEDIAISNITMRDVVDSPIFIRLGSRLRSADANAKVGQLRRVSISNIICDNADSRFGCIISGIPGHDVEDLKLSGIRIHYRGGGSKEQAATQPSESEQVYPDPAMFGQIPAYGFFVRHAKVIEADNITLTYIEKDFRPAFVLDRVEGVSLSRIKAQHQQDVPTFLLKNIKDFDLRECGRVHDVQRAVVEIEKF